MKLMILLNNIIIRLFQKGKKNLKINWLKERGPITINMFILSS